MRRKSYCYIERVTDSRRTAEHRENLTKNQKKFERQRHTGREYKKYRVT